MVDPKDVAYLVAGLALMGLTVLPMVSRGRPVSIPLIYVCAGAALALAPFALPVIDPRGNDFQRFLIEHLTEAIVIIALSAGGLAVDRRGDWPEWQHAIALLAVTMPLTVAALFGLGSWAGLSVGAAMLLAAALAPTDPVLARVVAVEGPNEGDEDDVRVSLTVEAGLNDGLAFPFVWLAVALGAAGAPSLWAGLGEVALDWILVDLGWRIGIACLVGQGIGWAFGRFVTGRWGDARAEGAGNAGLVFLGTTFVAYGACEALGGYGFLSVFLAARAGRATTRKHDEDRYAAKPHGFGEQAEKILLALVLLWLGGLCATGILQGLRPVEVAVALLCIFVVRPLAGWIALVPTRGDRFQKVAIAFFGIRGMGTFFYLAFGMGHMELGPDLDPLWRICVVTVLVSIALHGTLAPLAMNAVDRRRRTRDRA